MFPNCLRPPIRRPFQIQERLPIPFYVPIKVVWVESDEVSKFDAGERSIVPPSSHKTLLYPQVLGGFSDAQKRSVLGDGRGAQLHQRSAVCDELPTGTSVIG